MNSFRKQYGFTVLELSVVLAVIAGFAMVIYEPIMKRVESRKIYLTIMQAENIANEISTLAFHTPPDTTVLSVYDHKYAWGFSSDGQLIPNAPLSSYVRAKLSELDSLVSPFGNDYNITWTGIGVGVVTEIPVPPSNIMLPDSQKNWDQNTGVTTISIAKLYEPSSKFTFVKQSRKAAFDKQVYYKEEQIWY